MDGRQFWTLATGMCAALLLGGVAHAADKDSTACQCAGTVVHDTLMTVNGAHLPFPLQVTLHKGTGDGMAWFNQSKRNLWILPFPADPGFETRPHSIEVPRGKWSKCYCVSKLAANRVYHYYVSEKSKMDEAQEKKMQVGGVIIED